MLEPHGLAIVTGASSGIGAELTRQLAAAGHPVLAVARRAERLAALARAAHDAGHATVTPLALDVTAPDAATAIRDRARALGGARWLVNNAGTSRFGPFLDDSAAHLRLVRLNVDSVVALTAAVLPDLVAAGAGRVVNVASLAAFSPTPMQTVYGATKAFVLSFSEGLSVELAGTGVRVTAVCPGPVTTEIFDVAADAGVVRNKPRHEQTAEECVREALAGVAADRVVVVPGAFNKLTAVMGRLAPRALVRKVSRTAGLKYIGVELPPR